MKKTFIALLACLGLLSCGQAQPSSQAGQVSSNGAGTSSAQAEDTSSQEDATSIEEQSSVESIESLPPSSEEQETFEPFPLLPSDFTAMPSNSYPDPYVVEAGGHSFNVEDAGKNSYKGDSSNMVIQMRKQTSSIVSQDEIGGVLTIVSIVNSFHDYDNDVDVMATIAPVVEVALNGQKTTLTYTSQLSGDEKTYSFTYQSAKGIYSISNQSKYAQYVVEMSWSAE